MSQIVKSEEGVTIFAKRHTHLEGAHETGIRLTLSDGSIWFHPYSGRAPVCEQPASKEA